MKKSASLSCGMPSNRRASVFDRGLKKLVSSGLGTHTVSAWFTIGLCRTRSAIHADGATMVIGVPLRAQRFTLHCRAVRSRGIGSIAPVTSPAARIGHEPQPHSHRSHPFELVHPPVNAHMS